jgi:hypothetical protein
MLAKEGFLYKEPRQSIDRLFKLNITYFLEDNITIYKKRFCTGNTNFERNNCELLRKELTGEKDSMLLKIAVQKIVYDLYCYFEGLTEYKIR